MKQIIILIAIIFVAEKFTAQTILTAAKLFYTEEKSKIYNSGKQITEIGPVTISFNATTLRHDTKMKSLDAVSIATCSDKDVTCYVTDGNEKLSYTEDFFPPVYNIGTLGKFDARVVKLADEKVIRGLACNHALAVFGVEKGDTVDIWYTKEYKPEFGCGKYFLANLLKGTIVSMTYLYKNPAQIAGVNLENLVTLQLDSLKELDGENLMDINQREKYEHYSKDEILPKMMNLLGKGRTKVKTAENAAATRPESIIKKEIVMANGITTTLSVINPLLVGDKLPIIKAKGLDNNAKELNPSLHQYTVVNFWFDKCAPCIKEMPHFNNIVKKYGNTEKLGFYAVTYNTIAAVEAVLKNNEFNVTHLVDAQTSVDQIGVKSYPLTVIVDKDGKVVFSKVGNYLSEAELEKDINQFTQIK